MLNAAEIRRLLEALDAILLDEDSSHHHILVVGGAALALMWEDSARDRTTRDIADVLEHRFRAPPERRTSAVDLISMRFPTEMVNAVRLIAELEDLPDNWLNSSAAIFTPNGDLRPQLLHRGHCLTVESPCPELLLAMKLYARRNHDLMDSIRLAHDLSITRPAELVALVETAYNRDAAEASTNFAAQTALGVQQLMLDHPYDGPATDLGL